MTTETMELVALRRPAFIAGDRLYHGVADSHRLKSAGERRLLNELIQWAIPLSEAGALIKGRKPTQSYLDHLRGVYRNPENVVTLLPLQLGTHYDLVIAEQGYGGVYVHSYEVAKWFRKRGFRTLVASPADPMFERHRHPDDVTLPLLQSLSPKLDYLTYVHALRGLIRHYRPSLLLIAHRSQSLLLFDLIEQQPTIIYCDGYLDGGFDLARRSAMAMSDSKRGRVLRELQFMCASSGQGFHAVYGGPDVNRHLLHAGYHAMVSARENWFWGQKQHQNFVASMPQLREASRFVLPFTQPSLFRKTQCKRDKVALFTTTMHNIDKKGFPELVQLMTRMKSLRVRCVVRQPQMLPKYPDELRFRLEIGGLTKDEIVKLYHKVWCNIRTSREESSPLSVLETMTCEVPQVVSPAVAEQIPIIEDGRTGYVVDPDDIDRLVWCVGQLFTKRGLRDRMGAEARRRACKYSMKSRWGLFAKYLDASRRRTR